MTSPNDWLDLAAKHVAQLEAENEELRRKARTLDEGPLLQLRNYVKDLETKAEIDLSVVMPGEILGGSARLGVLESAVAAVKRGQYAMRVVKKLKEILGEEGDPADAIQHFISGAGHYYRVTAGGEQLDVSSYGGGWRCSGWTLPALQSAQILRRISVSELPTGLNNPSRVDDE